MVKITLPDWLYQGVVSYKKVLKTNQDYFRIRKPIDRRIYEIARKHCGDQHEFLISLEKLHLKTGSTALLKRFRHNIKELAKLNDLPDYEIFYCTEKDQVTFKNRKQDTPEADHSRRRESGKRAVYNIKKHLFNK